jgi:hypothetical protein
MQLVIDVVIGWDARRHRPNKEPGLFGIPKGYCISTESQNSGNLHAHMLLWVAGLPATSEEPRDLGMLERYRRAVCSVNVPVGLPTRCPQVWWA